MMILSSYDDTFAVAIVKTNIKISSGRRPIWAFSQLDDRSW